jgi:hypothetical protein
MRRKRQLIVPAFACFALMWVSVAQAQEGDRVLRVVDFTGDGLQSNETSALQNLVTSYVIELNLFKVIDLSGQELALREAETAVQLGEARVITPLVADYILSGRADKAGSMIILTMDVTKVISGEKKNVADSFASVNDLILASRRLTRSLFERPDVDGIAGSPESAATAPRPAASAHGVNNASPSLSLVSGTWKGDKNIDRVTIFPDGRAFAILASGVRMALKATIDGSAVLVSQNQPNSPDFYRPSLDLKTAKAVAASARPWRWVFSLSADNGNLVGVKESVFVTVDKGALSLDNNYVRSAQWTRLYR